MSHDNIPRSGQAQSPLLTITPMGWGDLSAIMALEHLCFESPWTADIYRRELRDNSFSFYHIVRPASPNTRMSLPSVLAYGGCWVTGDECHLMTIATHPDWRRRHLGEWLLLDLLAEARQRAAGRCMLEVRAGNRSAIGLYEKLGFFQVGLRRGYYPATNHSPREDAVLMTLFELDSGAVWRPLKRRMAEVQRTIEAGLLVG